jgi:hypothetical protein
MAAIETSFHRQFVHRTRQPPNFPVTYKIIGDNFHRVIVTYQHINLIRNVSKYVF